MKFGIIWLTCVSKLKPRGGWFVSSISASASFLCLSLCLPSFAAHVHGVCGGAECSVAGHGHDVEWQPIGELPKSAGNWYLTNDVEIAAKWIPPTGVALCLNGHSVRQTGAFGVCRVDGELAVTDCQPTPGVISGGSDADTEGGGAFFVTDSGALTLAGVTVSGNRSSNGGGVTCAGAFTMLGGRIRGNEATFIWGGGVLNSGAFTMHGGEISGNKTPVEFGQGGGVYNLTGGTFAMLGGTISGNAAGDSGGGVYNVESFAMHGGEIVGNESGGDGGGVYNGSEFAMRGGEVSGNSAKGDGADVCSSMTFAMHGGEIPAADGAVCVWGGTADVYGGVLLGASPFAVKAGALRVWGGLFSAAPGGLQSGWTAQTYDALGGKVVVAAEGSVTNVGSYLAGGTFAFAPTSGVYAAHGLILPDGAEISAAEGSPTTYALSTDSVVLWNGSFEDCAAAPAADSSAPFADANPSFWECVGEATVFGKDCKAWSDLGVADGVRAVAISAGASVSQRIEVKDEGEYVLSFRAAGRKGAQLRTSLAGGTWTFDVPADGCVARFAVSIVPGDASLRFENVGGAEVAVDGVALVRGSSSASRSEAAANGGFESGAPMPDADGMAAFAPSGSVRCASWTCESGAGVYGAECPAYGAGVAKGTYALWLDGGACVSQTVAVAEGYFAVGFSAASGAAGNSPAVAVTIDGEEVARVSTMADETWRSAKIVWLLDGGSHLVVIRNLSASCVALVDDFSIAPCSHDPSNMILNGGFEYGLGLPGEDGIDYAKPLGAVEISAWTLSGAAGVFRNGATSSSCVGVADEERSLFLEDASSASQKFYAESNGEYRVWFALAANSTDTVATAPQVDVTIDGASLGTIRALSGESWDTAVFRVKLETGEHELKLAASASAGQRVAVDSAFVCAVAAEIETVDVTGVPPAVRVVPYSAKCTLLCTESVREAETGDPNETIDASDFASDVTNDFFRLEPFAGAYPHPQYEAADVVQFQRGFAISVGGTAGEVDGTILSFEMTRVSDGKSSLFSFENLDGGKRVSVRRHMTDSAGLATNSFDWLVAEVPASSSALPRSFVLNFRDDAFALCVDGKPCACVPMVETSSLLFNKMRLGAMPKGTESEDLISRRCGRFALSDVRVYGVGLSDEQMLALAGSVRGTMVNVSAYDPVAGRVVASADCRVGYFYGEAASAEPASAGRTFVGWSLGSVGSGVWITPLTSVTNLTDHYIFANWSNHVYRVTYDFRGYPFAVNETREIEAGENYDPPDGFYVEGTTFRGWTNSCGQYVTSSTAFPSVGVCADETLYADFDSAFGTLCFNSHNGDPLNVVSNVEVGVSVLSRAPADPALSGYVFDGWWSGEAGGVRATEDTSFVNWHGETWHAHWIGVEQEVRWTAVGCSPETQVTHSRSGSSYVLPDAIPVSTNADADVKFYGWGYYFDFSDSSSLMEIAHYDYAADCWVTNEYAATLPCGHDVVALWWNACGFDANGGDVAEDKTYLRLGARVGEWGALPTPGRNGYVFCGWRANSVDGDRVDGDSVFTMNLPTNLVAAWSARSLTVTLDANGGSNAVDSVVVTYLEPYGAFPEPTRPGYSLASWHYVYEGGREIAPTSIVETFEDHVAVASWTNAWYAVGYAINGHPVVGRSFVQRYENPWPELYAPTPADLAAAGLDTNVVFNGWRLASTGEMVAEGETALMTSPDTLVADVSGAACTIVLHANGGELDVDGRTIVVEFGAKVPELPAAERDGCAFTGWFLADGTQVKAGDTWTRGGTSHLFAGWLGLVPHAMTFDPRRCVGDETHVEGVCYNADMPSPGVVPTRSDGAAFLGWWCGDVQCYGPDNKPLADFAKCPYLEDSTFTAHWAGLRDSLDTPFALVSGTAETVVGMDAADEPDEPDHDGELALRATHWYKFNGKAGDVVAVTFDDLSGVDSPCVALALYRGCAYSNLTLVASVVEWDSFTATMQVTLPGDGRYSLAVAQSGEGAALSAYSICASGFTGEQECWAPNLAAAYGVACVPDDVAVQILECEPTVTAGVNTLTLKLRATPSPSNHCDSALLVYALGVEGASSVGDGFSADNVTCEVIGVDGETLTVRVSPTQTSPAPEQFFYRGYAK